MQAKVCEVSEQEYPRQTTSVYFCQPFARLPFEEEGSASVPEGRVDGAENKQIPI